MLHNGLPKKIAGFTFVGFGGYSVSTYMRPIYSKEVLEFVHETAGPELGEFRETDLKPLGGDQLADCTIGGINSSPFFFLSSFLAFSVNSTLSPASKKQRTYISIVQRRSQVGILTSENRAENLLAKTAKKTDRPGQSSKFAFQ